MKLPDQIVDLVVSNILKKNGIDIETAKKNISPEQKQMMKDLVQDLTQRVNKFVNIQNQDNKKKKD